MKIKKVKWRDSRIYIPQIPEIDYDVSIVETVGFVIKEDKDKIVLAGDLIEDEFRRVIVIPRENIIGMSWKKVY